MITNPLNIQPNTIIGDHYEAELTLPAWAGFQSRQGYYGSKDREEVSDGKVRVNMEGKEVGNVQVFTEAQLKAIRYLVENDQQVRDTLLLGLLNELPELQDIYEDLMPEIDAIEDFRNYIGLANLHVMASDKDGFAYIGFELGCEWDDEHGVGVMMHKDRVLEIGQADTAFDAWITFDDNGTTEEETKKWHEDNAKIKAAKQISEKKKPWWRFW